MYATGGEAGGDHIALCHHILHSDIEMLECCPAGRDHIIHARDARPGGQWDVQGEVRGQQIIGGDKISS